MVAFPAWHHTWPIMGSLGRVKDLLQSQLKLKALTSDHDRRYTQPDPHSLHMNSQIRTRLTNKLHRIRQFDKPLLNSAAVLATACLVCPLPPLDRLLIDPTTAFLPSTPPAAFFWYVRESFEDFSGQSWSEEDLFQSDGIKRRRWGLCIQSIPFRSPQYVEYWTSLLLKRFLGKQIGIFFSNFGSCGRGFDPSESGPAWTR